MFNDNEQKKILSFCETLENDINLTIILTGSDYDTHFKDFSDDLNSLKCSISCVQKKADDGIPGIQIKENVIFHLVPKGKYLELILASVTYALQTLPEIQTKFADIQIYQKLKIYIAEQCPYCPAAVKKILEFGFCTNVKLEFIDGVFFHDVSAKDHITSTPVVLLDQTYRWTGVPNINEIHTILVDRDPSQLGSESLKEIIGEGRASDLTDLMIKKKKIFPAFYELVTHAKWSVRLGAMVVMEGLIEKERELSETAVPELWNRYERVDTSVRGDILYLIGETGHWGSLTKLKKVSTGDGPDDLIEAALDAMGRIEEIHH